MTSTRGLRVTLVSASNRCHRRNHGLLHSGVRYAVTDANHRECISENQILKRIARHCVEPTNGLFITLPKMTSFQTYSACEEAGSAQKL